MNHHHNPSQPVTSSQESGLLSQQCFILSHATSSCFPLTIPLTALCMQRILPSFPIAVPSPTTSTLHMSQPFMINTAQSLPDKPRALFRDGITRGQAINRAVRHSARAKTDEQDGWRFGSKIRQWQKLAENYPTMLFDCILNSEPHNRALSDIWHSLAKFDHPWDQWVKRASGSRIETLRFAIDVAGISKDDNNVALLCLHNPRSVCCGILWTSGKPDDGLLRCQSIGHLSRHNELYYGVCNSTNGFGAFFRIERTKAHVYRLWYAFFHLPA